MGAGADGSRTVFMFSGQGSQYFQMGQSSFENDPVFRRWVLELDARATRRIGCSIVDMLYGGHHRKMDPFDRLLITHPAIFIVEYAMARSLHDSGVHADAVLAVSMGTFAAAAHAGYVDVMEALDLVIDQAEIVEQTCAGGGMLAVLASVDVYRDKGLSALCALAGQNSPTHFIVAAPTHELAQAEALLRANQIVFQRLPVGFAFHSRWMEAAREPLLRRLGAGLAGTGRMPLACCAREDLLDTLPAGHLWTVCREPIGFQRTIARLEADGPHRYIDVGPGGTLATLAKNAIGPDTRSTMLQTMSPFGNDADRLARLRAQCLPPAVALQ